MKKRSFFERLTGAVNVDDDQFFDDAPRSSSTRPVQDPTPVSNSADELENHTNMPAEDEEEAQLTVDMYQTADDIYIRTIVAGVPPADLDVTITREMVTIKGRREESREVTEDDYFHRELYWGSFSRTILLPEEIDVELAEATEKHGVLTLRLPKVDKQKQTRLSVKAT